VDKGGWSINFSKDGDEYNFSNILEILNKNHFKAIDIDEIELEDTRGYSGDRLFWVVKKRVFMSVI